MTIEITDLAAMTSPATGDELLIYDIDAPTDKTKKVTLANLLSGVAFDGGNHSFGTLVSTTHTAQDATVNNITVAASMEVGNTGSTVTLIKGASLALAFTSIANGSSQTQTATLTGAVTTDFLAWSLTAHLADGLIAEAIISSADTVSLKIHNVSGGSLVPGSLTLQAMLHRAS